LKVKSGFAHVLVCIFIALATPVVSGCSTPVPSVTLSTTEANQQHIHYVIPAAPLLGRSVVEYYRDVSAGETIAGYIMVTGLWEVELDYATPWTFEALSPNGVVLDSATINYDIDPYHAFNFRAVTAGRYTLRAIHISLSIRELDIFVNPIGWEFGKQYLEGAIP
jgi:hypothetical protein